MNVQDNCKALGLHHKGIRLVLPGSTDSTSPLLVGLHPLSLQKLHPMDYSEEKIFQVYIHIIQIPENVHDIFRV